jgi:Sec-independent protein translocase protein TatA
MAAKKQLVKHEPLLTTVARKLGRAAGTFKKVTQEVTENLSTLPESVATKVREAARVNTSKKRSRVRTRHPRKEIRRAAQGQRTKRRAIAEKRRFPADKS